jgi:hypothetical protein
VDDDAQRLRQVEHSAPAERDAVLWNYAGCRDGVLGFDSERAIANAETRSARGELLGWTICAGTAVRSIRLMLVLNTEERSIR